MAKSRSARSPGTAPARQDTQREDIENRDSLLADPKERAEHLMLLDLGRNDVGRVAAAARSRSPTATWSNSTAM